MLTALLGLSIWRLYSREEGNDGVGAFLLFVILLLPTLALLSPYFVWVAVRDNRGSRWRALWVSAMEVWLLSAVGLLEGPWWAVLGSLAVSMVALVVIGVLARRDVLEEEKETDAERSAYSAFS